MSWTSHTQSDLARFARQGIDPDRTQPREHPVRCVMSRNCGNTTWNQDAVCDGCKENR